MRIKYFVYFLGSIIRAPKSINTIQGHRHKLQTPLIGRYFQKCSALFRFTLLRIIGDLPAPH